MSLKSDLEKTKRRQKRAEELHGAAGNDLQEIAKRILKGETTGNNLDDFCIVHPDAEKYLRGLDTDLGRYRKGLVLFVRENKIQTSCSITHGTYAWVQDYTVGINMAHEWDVKKGALLLRGKFAERKYRGDRQYRDSGDELRLDSHILSLTQFSFIGNLLKGSLWGDRYHLLVGDAARSTILGKQNFDWHAYANMGSAFSIIDYMPDKELAAFLGFTK